MLLENTDLDGADDAQLDLFYLVDRVLEEIELAAQATDAKQDKENIDDCNMPAATPEFDTFDLMDEIDTTGQYTEPFCPNSTSLNNKSAQVQQFYQQSQLFDTSFDDVTGNQHVVPEIDMDQLIYDSLVNNQFHVSPEDKSIPHTDCQFTAQDFYNHNVQDVVAAQVNTEYVGNSEEQVDLSFPEIPALTRYTEVSKYISGSNAQSVPHHDENSNDAHHSDFKGWTRKHPESWTTSDVLDWLFHCAEKIAAEIGEDCSSLRAEAFSNVTGKTLCQMGPEDFRLREPKFGLSFYELLRQLLHEGVSFTHPLELSRDQSESDTSYTETEVQGQQFSSPQVTDFGTVHSYVNTVNSGQSSSCTSPEMYPTYFPFGYDSASLGQAVTSPNSAEHQISHLYQNNMKSYDNYSTYNYHYYHRHLQSDITSVRAKYENGITPIRRRPGRPRTKTIQTEEELQAQRAKKLKSQHLWEFIYELLNNPSYNPSVLKWENQANGVFRFIQSETVAQLWGNLKSNEHMTYEKLSRAMRHYYKRGIMERVEGRRLVYKYSRATLDKMRQKHGFQT